MGGYKHKLQPTNYYMHGLMTIGSAFAPALVIVALSHESLLFHRFASLGLSGTSKSAFRIRILREPAKDQGEYDDTWPGNRLLDSTQEA